MTEYATTAARERLHEALKSWHECWTLDGLYVACPNCHAQQVADDARKPFLHLGPCVLATEFGKYPWLELRNVLADLPAVAV